LSSVANGFDALVIETASGAIIADFESLIPCTRADRVLGIPHRQRRSNRDRIDDKQAGPSSSTTLAVNDRPEVDSVWLDDFDGHWLNIEDVDDEQLIEILTKTLDAIDDPVLLIQQPFVWYWQDQLSRVLNELHRRGFGSE
jgi:hypothetical protein